MADPLTQHGHRDEKGPTGTDADPRSLLRRSASRAKASVRRSVKRVARLVEVVLRWAHRQRLIARKRLLEGSKNAHHRLLRAGRVARKRHWLLMRWIRRMRRLLWRLATLRKVDRFGRTRTTKRAAESRLAALDRKPFEPALLDRRNDIRVLRRTVTRFSRSSTPIIVGPWLTEIGFELLYWIPFVHWVKAYGDLHDRDLWIVSRGGTTSWYRNVTANYIEIFDLFSPDEFRSKNEARQRQQGGIKHRAVSAFDQEILEQARRHLGQPTVEVLHPSLMYNLYQPFFQKLVPFRLVEAFSFYAKIFEGSPKVSPYGLPAEYVAVKFYGNDAFPMTAPNRALVARLLGALTRRGQVVSLDTATRYDDHVDFEGVDRSRLHSIENLVAPADNLEIQSRIIHGARTFYCTYGGFSYLAPLCDTRTVTFYSRRQGFRLEHLELARRVFAKLGCPPFLALDVAELELLSSLSALANLAV